MDAILKNLTELDQKLVRAAKGIKVLSSLSWPIKHQSRFLDGWHKKNPQIPQVKPNRADYGQALTELQKIRKQADQSHPIGKYIQNTAQSYIHAAHLLENQGTPTMLEHCIAIYGRPGDRLKGSKFTVLDAARYFIQTADETSRQFDFESGEYCVTADALKNQLEGAMSQVFTRHQVNVVLDPKMASKAAAGPKRIRLRDNTCFSRFDYGQLLQHEILVHTLTALNGLEQPHLGSMGLGAPRTTAAQEGLATFAELVTGAIDLSRLKRIALRILAVNMGLEGADFIDVFRFFLESGQEEMESYHSTVRVFRGGDPRGTGVVFTKDAVYLQGLISAHTFFRWAMSHDKLAYLHYAFAGRLTFDDVVELEPFFKSEYIQKPLYMPQWLESVQALAAYLAFSLFSNRIHLDHLDADETGFSSTGKEKQG